MKKKEKSDAGSSTPWSGRFSSGVDPIVQRYTRSIHFDRRLAEQDIRGSRAHVRMLAAQGLISSDDERSILGGLDQITEEIRSGTFPYRDEYEDIHMNIEMRLQELIGKPAGRLHTGRSRNDQVALDLKLFCLETAVTWQGQLAQSITAVVERAESSIDQLFPAWTHLQAAQPLSWAHYLLAFAEMLYRDHRRLDNYCELHSVSPLGAGALSGSSLPLDPERTAQELDFREPFRNSYDVVGDRDTVLELLQIATQLAIHMSRLAEDMVYFTSTPVGWIDLPDSLCTGSSMMPQKKNPDILELMRGRAASVIGHTTALSTLLKGLPTSYQRDLQQDKQHLFEVVDIVSDSLSLLLPLFSDLKIHSRRSGSALENGFLMATELAEYLVGLGIPFREAHHKVGGLVRFCLEEGVGLEKLSFEVIKEQIPECEAEVTDVLDPQAVLSRRQHSGSTGRKPIQTQLSWWANWIESVRKKQP